MALKFSYVWGFVAIVAAGCGSGFEVPPCDDACATNATCADDSSGGSCICNDGFAGDGTTCDNIDECALGTSSCAADATCTDTAGSFECACGEGLVGDGITCTVLTAEPATGIVSTIVTVHGAGFGETAGSLTFGGAPASVLLWSDSGIQAAVPDVFPGLVDIVVTPQGQGDLRIPFTVTLPPRVFLRTNPALIDGNNALIVFDYDPATKQLKEATQSPIELGSPASTSTPRCTNGILLHRATRRLFVTSSVSLDIFDMDPVSGELTAILDSPLALPGNSSGVAVNSAGDRVFAHSRAPAVISVFDIQGDGSFAEATDSPTSTPTVEHVMVSDNGAFAYLFNIITAYSYAVGPLNGGLTSQQTFSDADSYPAFQRRPNANQVVLSGIGAEFSIATFDDTTGGLSLIAGAPFAGPAGSSYSTAFSADGTRLFVAGRSGPNPLMAVYDLAADGTPTIVTGSPYALGGMRDTQSCIRISQDGEVLFAASGSGEHVGVFALDAKGTPTAVESSPFTYGTADTAPNSMVVSF